MPAVLIGDAGKRLGLVVGIQALRRAENGRAGVNQQMNVALQMNRAAQIRSRRHQHRAATSLGGGMDGLVNGRAVKGFAVAHGAEAADVEIILAGGFGGLRDAAGAQPKGKNEDGGNGFGFHGMV